MQLKPGTKLQGCRFEILRTLGQGGFGITYEVEQVLLGRKYALKEFFMKDCCERDEATSQVTVGTGSQRNLVEKFRGKFIREARMLAGMDHPNIVRVLDVFEENGTAYYVMENLPGGSLSDKVKREGPLPEALAEKYIRQVADALAYVHSLNTVHLDVKPSNILLNAKGDAVLIDFGISKHYDDAGEQTSSTPVGISKGYAPLEQGRDGDVAQFKPSTDIYALGATLYHLLTGSVPPEASIVNEDGLDRPKGVSDRMWNVIEQAMQPRRKDRPQTIASFLMLMTPGGISAVPVVSSVSEATSVVHEDDTQPVSEPIADSKVEPQNAPEPPTLNQAPEKKKAKAWIWLLLACLAVAAIVILALNHTPKTRQEGYQPAGITQSDIDSVSYIMGYSLGKQMDGLFDSISMNSINDANNKSIINGIRDADADKEIEYEYFQSFINEFKNISKPSQAKVDSAYYLMGYSFGMQLKQNDFGSLNYDYIIKGVQAATSGVEIDYEQFQRIVNGFLDKRSQLIGEEMKKRSDRMFLDKSKETGVVKTESGLLYKIIRQGSGVKPSSSDTVEVHYEGTNLDGKVFDSSYERDQTASFPLNAVISGWQEGLQHVSEGGEIILWIPADLAYGERGAGNDIRPNEALTFKVDLIAVKPVK